MQVFQRDVYVTNGWSIVRANCLGLHLAVGTQNVFDLSRFQKSTGTKHRYALSCDSLNICDSKLSDLTPSSNHT